MLTELRTDKIRNLVAQAEVGGNTGRLHIQGFIRFEGKTGGERITAVKKMFDANHGWNTSFRTARGTAKQNLKYCTKDETKVAELNAVVYGEDWEDHQGKRTDLDSFAKAIRQDGLQAVYDSGEYDTQLLKFPSGAQKLNARIQHSKVPERRELEVFVLVGRPGCGKSYMAMEGNIERFGKNEVYRWPTGHWMTEMYNGEKIAVLDDYSGHWMSHSQAKQLNDPYKIEQQVKGSHATPAFEQIWYTTNFPPTDWYDDKLDLWTINWTPTPDGEDGPPAVWLNGNKVMAPIERRISEIYYIEGFFNKNVKPPRWTKPQIIWRLDRTFDERSGEQLEPKWALTEYNTYNLHVWISAKFKPILQRKLLRKRLMKIFQNVLGVDNSTEVNLWCDNYEARKYQWNQTELVTSYEEQQGDPSQDIDTMLSQFMAEQEEIESSDDWPSGDFSIGEGDWASYNQAYNAGQDAWANMLNKTDEDTKKDWEIW